MTLLDLLKQKEHVLAIEAEIVGRLLDQTRAAIRAEEAKSKKSDFFDPLNHRVREAARP